MCTVSSQITNYNNKRKRDPHFARHHCRFWINPVPVIPPATCKGQHASCGVLQTDWYIWEFVILPKQNDRINSCACVVLYCSFNIVKSAWGCGHWVSLQLRNLILLSDNNLMVQCNWDNNLQDITMCLLCSNTTDVGLIWVTELWEMLFTVAGLYRAPLIHMYTESFQLGRDRSSQMRLV